MTDLAVNFTILSSDPVSAIKLTSPSNFDLEFMILVYSDTSTSFI